MPSSDSTFLTAYLHLIGIGMEYQYLIALLKGYFIHYSNSILSSLELKTYYIPDFIMPNISKLPFFFFKPTEENAGPVVG